MEQFILTGLEEMGMYLIRKRHWNIKSFRMQSIFSELFVFAIVFRFLFR